MPDKGFTHLHLHSQFSLLDGAINFDKLLRRCKELNMTSVAVTDHGNMFGTLAFYIKAKAAHIKPIIGLEAYIAPGSRFDKQKCSIKDASYHLLLLAENNTGYQNLLKLSTIGFTEGFYYRPRIDRQILAEFSEGLICTSACLKGEIAKSSARTTFSSKYKTMKMMIPMSAGRSSTWLKKCQCRSSLQMMSTSSMKMITMRTIASP
ncbi:MAG: PHP domain-containing protein, partial [Planctomycetota bacterium]